MVCRVSLRGKNGWQDAISFGKNFQSRRQDLSSVEVDYIRQKCSSWRVVMFHVHLAVPVNEDGIDKINKECTFCSKSSSCDPQGRTKWKE